MLQLFVMRIDLNADVGEGFASDAELIPLLSSANISCGVHAGSAELTRQTISYCQQFGVRIGAHPSYPDRANFGRIRPALSDTALAQSLTQQLLEFNGFAQELGAKVSYVKAHGALYNDLMDDQTLAQQYLAVLQSAMPNCAIMTMPYGALFETAMQRGLTVIKEGFADRRYLSNGRLTPRQQQGALLAPSETLMQALQLARSLPIRANAAELAIAVESICLHGDNPHAVAQARLIRQLLLRQGFCIAGASA